jgi:Flp pilus assembly protein TadG
MKQRFHTLRFALSRALARLRRDERGLAATEFAMIVPLMMVMFFGTVEFSSGIAVDRKVTLVARTLSDLTSQSLSVTDADLTNFFAASNLIIWPYSTTPISATVTQLYINPTTLKASVQWSKGSAPRGNGTFVTIPASLAVANTYLIYSEVSYGYVPTVGYVMGTAGVTLSDVNYTRPRQSTCVLYGTTTCTTA